MKISNIGASVMSSCGGRLREPWNLRGKLESNKFTARLSVHSFPPCHDNQKDMILTGEIHSQRYSGPVNTRCTRQCSLFRTLYPPYCVTYSLLLPSSRDDILRSTIEGEDEDTPWSLIDHQSSHFLSEIFLGPLPYSCRLPESGVSTD